jgi:F-type H+-transporting ATPase subunit gamma
MVNLKEIVKEIEELFNMRYLVGAYEEIASMRMRKIRNSVLVHREFSEELAEIYQELTLSYRDQIVRLLKVKGKSKSLSVREHNGKIGVVFLSANGGLFGDILHKTYNAWIKYIDEHEAEPIIIGSYGKKMFESNFPGRPFIFLELSEEENNLKALKIIADKFVEYDNIVIFYSQFISMGQQNVAVMDMLGQEKNAAGQPAAKVHYIFEPSLEKVLEFFENQIFSTILNQTFTESELARYAARMVALDAATENISARLKSVDLEKRIALHRIANKKQLESISSMALW